MTLFFIIVFALYFIFVLMLSFGWARAMEPYPERRKQREVLLSVVIPFRNEEKTLPHLFKSLEKQILAPHEIIFVNDHSTDQSLNLAQGWNNKQSNVKVLSLENTFGKKAALSTGIGLATGNWIVTTDADCGMEPTWIKSMKEQIENSDALMVAGPWRIEGATFFSKLQALELASLVGTSAAAIAWGKPVFCSGANLAFEKNTFEQVNGYAGNEHIASGDDQFLMQKFQTSYPGKIKFLHDPGAIVFTSSQPNISSFLHQRIRWAGKWKDSSVLNQLLAISVFGFHMINVALFIGLLFSFADRQILFSLLLSKFFGEMIFLFPVTHFLKIKWSWISFFTLQFIYSFYVVAVAILSFRKSFIWKGREVKMV